jgi:crotonobetainyl-CoA:carnitine CoA-transferase CaiB-like acyl-CoA transferase
MRPLEGIRVVEAASFVSGPFAGLMLADLGAEVIKVEPPTGDPHRRFGPADEAGGLLFQAINQGKRCIRLDLTTDDGMTPLAELLAGADVLLSNWRPGVAEAFGLTAESVTERWPQLVWVRVSGYGQTGPMAQAPAFDSIIMARVGVLDAVAAATGGSPALLPMYLADKVTAGYAAQSALAAIVQRQRTGRGAVVDIAMLDAMAHFDTPDLFAGHQRPGVHDDRVDRVLSSARPLQTADGWIVIAPVTGRQVKRALEAVGLADRAPALRTLSDPLAVSEQFFALLDGHLAGRTTAAWLDVFTAADVPAGPVMRIAEHLDDAQVAHNAIYRAAAGDDGRPVIRTRHPWTN